MNEQLRVIISAETQEFQRGVRAAQEEIKRLKASTKEAAQATQQCIQTARGWGNIQDPIDRVGSASDQLTDVLRRQEKQLNQLKVGYINAASEYGNSSEEAQQFARQIEALSKELKANKEAFMKAAQEAEDFANATEEAEKPIKSLKQKIKDYVKEGTKDLGALSEGFQKVGNVSNTTLKVMGGALVGAIGSLGALAGSTKEYREQQALLSAAFQNAGSNAEVAKETYNDLYRVLGDSGQATEAAQHLAKLTTNEKELSEWTNICQGVYATFGESLPIESLTEAVNHSAKLGEVQGTLADALEWSGINVDEFNEQLFWCNTEAEREKLIRDTLNGEYADAATLYETTAGAVMDQNTAQQQLTDAMAALGEATAPILTMLTSLLTDVITPLIPEFQAFINEYGPEIESLLTSIADAVGAVLKWVIDNWELVSTIAIIIAGIATAISIVSTALTVYNAVMAITSVVSAPVIGIIALIVAAIAALIAIIVLVIKYWDEIWAACKKAWDAIVNAIKVAIDWIVNLFTKMIDWVKQNWQGLLLLLVNPFAGAFKLLYDNCEGFRNVINNLFNNVKTIFTNIGNTIKEKFNAAANTVKSIIDKIKGFFKFEWSLPKLKVPKFAITPSGWEIGDLLKGVIPKLGITWNARGGVFDRPTIMSYGDSLQGLGENGAEAVVPLENNLEWLDKLATMMANKLGNDKPVVLTVDGKVFAKTAIRTINADTKQTGKLALNIM